MYERHGKTNTKLYRIWVGIKKRCSNPDNHCFKRGITVYPEWEESFSAFEEWALEAGYSDVKDLTIDRIDNNGDYEPDNCQFISHSENVRRTQYQHLFASLHPDDFDYRYMHFLPDPTGEEKYGKSVKDIQFDQKT
jgi:hypothetical protein